MKYISRSLCGIAICLLFTAVGTVNADFVDSSNLSIESNTLGVFSGDWVAENMINGSGMGSYDPSTLHDPITEGNTWFSPSGVTTGTFVVDLGAIRGINAVYIWNETDGSLVTGQQIPFINLETSTDNSSYSFTSLGAGPLGILPGGDFGQSDFMPSAELAFDGVDARYVRFTVLGSGGGSLVGLREVAFNKIPEPTSVSLIALLGGMLTLRRKRR